MKKLLAALALALCMSNPALSQTLSGITEHGQEVELTVNQCTNGKVLEIAVHAERLLGAPRVGLAGKAKIESGDIVQFCYTRINKTTVFAIDENGNMGSINISKFKESI